MASFDHADPPRRQAMAVAGGGDAGQPRRLQFQRIEILPPRGPRHRGGALAGGEANHPAFWHRRQMPAQRDIWMRSGHGGVKDRAQKRASVGHFSRCLLEEWNAGYPSNRPKRKPPQAPDRGGFRISYRPIGRRDQPPTSASMMSPKRSQASPLNLMS